MSAKSPMYAILAQLFVGVMIAAVSFGVIQFCFPNVLLIHSQKLLEIEPSSTFICDAHRAEIVKATFTVRNISSSELKILGVAASCSCAAVETQLPLRLAPGGVGQIRMRLAVGDPGPDGKFTKTANLFVDVNGPVPTLTLQAKVIDQSPI